VSTNSPLGFALDPSSMPGYIKPQGDMPGGFRQGPYGRGGYTSGGGTNYSAGLTTVSDPDKTYADLTRQDYLDYKRDYSEFEDKLIDDARNDTSLIDQAQEDAVKASGLAAGIASRNASRYGGTLTPAQLKEQERSLQRGNALGKSQALSDARIAQGELNTQKMADLINIGQGVNRTSLSQLGSAAADATNRKNAYANARAQSKANTYGAIGSLGSAAIMAFAF
jgi:hypothetical protein